MYKMNMLKPIDIKTKFEKIPATINAELVKEILSVEELKEYFKGKHVRSFECNEFVVFCNPDFPPVCIKKKLL